MPADQIESELRGVLELIDEIYSVFGFTYHVELSTRPEDSMGSDELWEEAESSLQRVLDGADVSYKVNPGDGAFYGPKIDFHIKDALGRTWQCATVQLDFNLPERFDLTYVGQDNERYRPVVIHRAIFGSVDRFMGILTEHFAGAFPLWLAPVQARVVTVSDEFTAYAEDVKNKLMDAGLRVDVDARSEKIGYKIREAQIHKVPYTLVVGEKERADGGVSVRKYGQGDLGFTMLGDFLQRAKSEISDKQFLVES